MPALFLLGRETRLWVLLVPIIELRHSRVNHFVVVGRRIVLSTASQKWSHKSLKKPTVRQLLMHEGPSLYIGSYNITVLTVSST